MTNESLNSTPETAAVLDERASRADDQSAEATPPAEPILERIEKLELEVDEAKKQIRDSLAELNEALGKR